MGPYRVREGQPTHNLLRGAAAALAIHAVHVSCASQRDMSHANTPGETRPTPTADATAASLLPAAGTPPLVCVAVMRRTRDCGAGQHLRSSVSGHRQSARADDAVGGSAASAGASI